MALDPPSDDEVMAALVKAKPAQRGALTLSARRRINVRIVKTKIADYVDPMRVYPLIGPAQQHHAHYKCTIYYDDVRRLGTYTFGSKAVQEVLYIDHSHLHMKSDQPSQAGAAMDGVTALAREVAPRDD